MKENETGSAWLHTAPLAFFPLSHSLFFLKRQCFRSPFLKTLPRSCLKYSPLLISKTFIHCFPLSPSSPILTFAHTLVWRLVT